MSDKETLCENCKRGSHLECEGENIYGEPCECKYCERQARESAIK